MKKQHIKFKSVLSDNARKKIIIWSNKKRSIIELIDLIIDFQIDCSIDKDIIDGYSRDWSNIPGNAEAITRPKTEYECAIIMFACNRSKIPITITAGQTNLNGSATPIGGIVLSIEKMKTPIIKVDISAKSVLSPVGIYLEDMRKECLNQSNQSLYYPVDPTSRNEAMVGGTLSCNASGFVPGPAGATRYWVKSLNFLTLTGYKITCLRGQYISNKGQFILDYGSHKEILEVPTYPRPNIKNASGPYSSENGILDFVDLVIGSEGIFGLISSVTFNLKIMPSNFLNLFFTLPNEENAIKFHKYLIDYFKYDLSQITALEYFGYNCRSYMEGWEKLFKIEDEVGIYLQIPLYDDTIDIAAEKWFRIIQSSNCQVNQEAIILLNDPRNWQIFFNARHSIPVNALKKTHQLDTWSILTDTIVPPENFKFFLIKTHKILRESKIEYLLFGHLGDCHLHFHMIPTKVQQKMALTIYDEIIKQSNKLGGVYSAEHGTGKRKRSDFLECYGIKGVKNIHKTKMIFDPEYLLNRGNVIEYTM